MYPSQIRRPLVAAAALVAWAVFAPAHVATAGGLQIVDPSNACSWTFDPTAQTLTCNPTVQQPPPPDAPTGCGTPTIGIPTPLTNTAGGTVNLDIQGCTASPGPVTYNWSRNGASGWKTSQSPSDSLPANTAASDKTYSYQVKACNGSSCTNFMPASPLTAVVPGTPGGSGGGSGGAVSCTGFKTINLDLDNATGTAVSGTFGNGDIVVARFHTPVNMINNGGGGLVSVGEYAGSPAKRTLAISTTACLFDKNAQKSNYLSGYTQPTINFGSGGLPLEPDTTYYVNIVNRYPGPTGSGTCTTGNCGIIVTRILP